MTDNTTADAQAFETLVTEQRAAALTAILEGSAALVDLEDSITAAMGGLAPTTVALVERITGAVDLGLSLGSIASALKADAESNGTRHPWQSAASLTYATTLGAFLALDGDIPDGWTVRDADSPVALAAGERSIYTLIRLVSRGKDAAKILKAAKVPYGKAAIMAALDASESKAEALASLVKIEAAIDQAIADAAKQREDDGEGGESGKGSKGEPKPAGERLLSALKAASDSLAAASTIAQESGLVIDPDTDMALNEVDLKITALALALGIALGGEAESETDGEQA